MAIGRVTLSLKSSFSTYEQHGVSCLFSANDSVTDPCERAGMTRFRNGLCEENSLGPTYYEGIYFFLSRARLKYILKKTMCS